MKTFIAMALLFSHLSFAKDQDLSIITSDMDENTSIYSVEIKEDGTIDSLRLVTTAPNGAIVEDTTHPANRVMNDGANLVERSGRVAVKMMVENFSLKDGGTVVLRYLFNGATGTHKILKLKLARQNGIFVLFNMEGERVNRFFFHGHFKRIIGLVGIRDIETSFDTTFGK